MVILDLRTEARLQARVIFNREGSELIYNGLQVLNEQTTPPVWEAPTTEVVEHRIIEATGVALKQILTLPF